MSSDAVTSSRPHVVIAGGGFAALEAVLALRALAGDGVSIDLISPNPSFPYRPAATLEVFEEVAPLNYDLRAIAEDLEFGYHRSTLEAVAPKQKWVRLGSGGRLHYDALILALGVRARAAVPGALTFRDQRDVAKLRGLLDDLDRGVVGRLAFAVPSGCSWPLPLYELALLSAARAAERRLSTEITVVTPEPEPLAVFGSEASSLVAALLADGGVQFRGGTVAGSVLRSGSVALAFDAPIQADRVVAAPQLRGQRITGIPASWWGFVPTDMSGRVQGLTDVYAAGDISAYPVKQGGVATQQADRVAEAIAEAAGFTVRRPRAGFVLRAQLLGGPRPLFLRSELGELGHASRATLEYAESEDLPGTTKVFGRYLTPYLEGRVPAVLPA